MAEYRQMITGDADAMFDLWETTWPGARRERALARLRSEPHYLQHTFVATGDGGQLLATAHYWLREICDAQGVPRPVGCVSHVAVREDARRQGHARTLVQMAHDAIRADGCDYALLFSSKMGVPLYESMGYGHVHAPYWQGLISRERPAGGGGYTVSEPDPSAEETARTLARIYDAFNANRPATLVRDLSYWQTFITNSLGEGSWDDYRSFVLAASRDDDETCAYAIVHMSNEEAARRDYNLDQIFSISEIGVLPGHDGAIPALLAAVVDRLRPGGVGGRAYVPREPRFDEPVRVMFNESLHEPDDRDLMAVPLSPAVTFEDIHAIWSAPGACYWQSDDF